MSSSNACDSVSGYLTNDHQNKISFLSTRTAIDSNVFSLIKEAAVRSLSCEVIPGKEGGFGQIYFGDSTRGHVLSWTFFLKDAEARGFHRWYSFVIFMKDKHLLLNSWPFFEKHMRQIVNKLQRNAAQVFSREQNICSQRVLRLTNSNQKNSPARSLIKLTSNTAIFAQLHLWFAWLLSTGGKRLEEQAQTKLFSDNLSKKFVFRLGSNKKEENIFDQDECIKHFRWLRRILGASNFQKIVYSTLIGRQIIVRGPRVFVLLILHLLQMILPSEKFRCIDFGEKYMGPEICNILGLNLFAAVPKSSETILRLDIIPIQSSSEYFESIDDAYNHYKFFMKTECDVPQKLPSLLTEIDKALSDETLNHRVVRLHIASLMEQWHHLAEVVREAKKKKNEMKWTDLMQLLGIHDNDEKLVEFWAS